jgi:hypothetical protein
MRHRAQGPTSDAKALYLLKYYFSVEGTVLEGFTGRH